MALYYQGNFLRIFNSIPTCLQETAGIGELNQSFNAKSSPPHPKKMTFLQEAGRLRVTIIWQA